jgi:hypothetical protein
MRHTDRVGDAKWFEGWVPWPELAGLAAAGRALLPNTLPTTPAGVLRFAGERLLGRRVTATVGDNVVELTLTRLDYEADTFALATGRLGDVRVVAEDVTWPETPFKTVVLLAKDVRFRSLPTPTVKPASMEIEIVVSADVVTRMAAESRPGVVVSPGYGGMVEVRWARHPRWGFVELEPSVEESAVLLRPRVLRVAGRRFRLPRRLKPIELDLPEFPPGLRLVTVEPRGDELALHGVAEQWPEKLSKIPLSDLLSWLTTTALTLTMPAVSPRRRA